MGDPSRGRVTADRIDTGLDLRAEDRRHEQIGRTLGVSAFALSRAVTHDRVRVRSRPSTAYRSSHSSKPIPELCCEDSCTGGGFATPGWACSTKRRDQGEQCTYATR